MSDNGTLDEMTEQVLDCQVCFLDVGRRRFRYLDGYVRKTGEATTLAGQRYDPKAHRPRPLGGLHDVR